MHFPYVLPSARGTARQTVSNAASLVSIKRDIKLKNILKESGEF